MIQDKELIVITGGAGGIGTAVAKTFKNQHIIITDYSADIVNKAVENLKDDGYSASGLACDITDKEEVNKLVKFVSESGKLKALIHTAGVSGTVQDLEKIFTIDLKATEILVDAFYEIATNGSVAILLSSMMAHTVPANEAYDDALTHPQKEGSFETVRQYVQEDSNLMYNFAKRGVQLVSINHADKWGAKGARILTVSPGVIETAMAKKANEEHPEQMEMIKKATPLKRNGSPEDVAEVINFLSSDKASFINATDILIDGGVIHNIKLMMSSNKGD
ncbi:SDR family oxidoreductase [Flavobacteriaceae bacterium Ap0902]|nr:SDR family oxidoreductase [Flavobacteriaceae bacterium Ap0902]